MKGPKPGNCQSANACQYPKRTAYCGPSAGTGRSAFGRFSVLLVGEILGAHVAWQQDRNIFGAEARGD